MKPFRLVAGLWVMAEVDGVVPDGEGLPFVDHDQLDYVALSALVHSHLLGGGPAAVRFANDTVDQVTVHLRMVGPTSESAECLDFGDCLLEQAIAPGNPIDVRAAWAPLHFHRDRTQAPPPSLLLFVLEGEFEEVMIRFNQAGQRLGMKSAELGVMLAGNMTAADQIGTLPTGFHGALTSHFRINFKRDCLLARFGHSPLPGWARGVPLM